MRCIWIVLPDPDDAGSVQTKLAGADESRATAVGNDEGDDEDNGGGDGGESAATTC